MNRKKFYLTFLIALITITLSACGQKKNESVYQTVRQTKTINWGVKADTPLFGSMSVKDSKIRGFEIDLAEALTHKMLGKNAKANFVTTTAMLAFRQARFGAGCGDRFVNHFFVSERFYYFLLYKHFVATPAMLAFR